MIQQKWIGILEDSLLQKNFINPVHTLVIV